MNPHLTDEQLDHFLTHESEAHPHLATCAPCREQLATLRAAFTGLRLSLTGLAESLPTQPAYTPVRTNSTRTAWTLAAAALALAVAVVPSFHHHPGTPTAQPATATQQEDEALLEGINQDLSSPIAPSLRPLALDTKQAQ